MTHKQSVVYRFSSFTFQRDTGKLQRNGYAIRLNDQAARVLTEFLDHPGELIARPRLCELLWPDGVYTESELGINKIISKLRIELRDNPKTPRYIETIPKRGYRFLAPVVAVGAGFEEQAVPEQGSERTSGGEAELGSTDDSAELPPTKTPPEDNRKPLMPMNAWLAVAALVGICLVGGIVWQIRQPAPPSAPNQQASLAVAPFEVKNSDAGQEQLAESFRLDLIDSLAQMPGITVRAAHSVSGKVWDTLGHPAPQKLDVTSILYTEFARSGDLYTLQMELVRNSDSAHLHTWRYSGTVAQFGSIRQQAQADIFSYWHGANRAQAENTGETRDPAAYELYLRARYHVRQRDDESLKRARTEFLESIDHDHGFAKAYSGLALVTFLLAQSEADFKEAETLSRKAMQLAPNLAEAHAVLGYILFRHDWHFAEGEQEERKAIALDPHDPNNRVWLAYMLAKLGRFDESSNEIETAKRDDPYWVEIYVGEVFLSLSAHQYDRMMKAIDTLVSLKPDWDISYHERAWANWALGRYPQAIADWRRVAQMKGDAGRVAFEDRGLKAYQAGGEKAYAKLRMDAAIKYQKLGKQDGDFVPAEWAAYAGDYDACLSDLNLVIDRHEREATNIAINPAYQPLHRDPRFRALVRRMGLSLADAPL